MGAVLQSQAACKLLKVVEIEALTRERSSVNQGNPDDSRTRKRRRVRDLKLAKHQLLTVPKAAEAPPNREPLLVLNLLSSPPNEGSKILIVLLLYL